MIVNQRVVGSSPTGRAENQALTKINRRCFFHLIHDLIHVGLKVNFNNQNLIFYTALKAVLKNETVQSKRSVQSRQALNKKRISKILDILSGIN